MKQLTYPLVTVSVICLFWVTVPLGLVTCCTRLSTPVPRELLISSYHTPIQCCICQGSVVIMLTALRLKTRVAVLASINDATRQPHVQYSRSDKNRSLGINRLISTLL